MNKNKFTNYKPDFELDKLKIQEFFEHYNSRGMMDDEYHGNKKYLAQLVCL